LKPKIYLNDYKVPSFDEALQMLELQGADCHKLLAKANTVRHAFCGDDVHLCAIVNAKSGRCSENCAFCSQSAYSKSDVAVYPLLSSEEIIEKAAKAKQAGAIRFSIVTSGKGIANADELQQICNTVSGIKDLGLKACGSLGVLDKSQVERLKEAGLDRLHHNLETSESFYPEICTTHDYADRVETVKAADDAGMEVCCGGIFGLGESLRQRVEMAFAIKDLPVDSVPVNFLNPRPGTKLEGRPFMQPLECLKIIAVLRLVMPDRRIIICGGRAENLRQLQPLVLLAGANGLMIGDYLTTQGRGSSEDIKMIEDLGFKVKEIND